MRKRLHLTLSLSRETHSWLIQKAASEHKYRDQFVEDLIEQARAMDALQRRLPPGPTDPEPGQPRTQGERAMNTATETTLITWVPGKHSGFQGSANGIPLFSISWSMQRGQPDWSMQTGLPGTSSRGWQSDDIEELKAKAEKVLANWIARVTYRRAKTETPGGEQ